MTTRPDLEALIARLEAAKKGSQKLNAAIWRVVDWRSFSICYHNATSGLPRQIPVELSAGLGKLAVKRMAPDFTRSVDAALTLVPDGLCWRYDSALGRAQIFDLARSPIEVAESGNVELTSYPPALALCIAALRARIAEMEDGR